MKKLLYIGHAYHNKTKSTKFLQDILSSEYEVEKFDFDPYSDTFDVFQNLKGKKFDVVVIFQIMPSVDKLKELVDYKKIVFFPMYDGVIPLTDHRWYEYRDCNIINFSKTLHEKCKEYGLSSYYIQYFPKPMPVENFGDEKSVFLWQRIKDINPETVDNVIGFDNINKFYHHQAPDPNQYVVATHPKYLDKVEVSTWFATKDDMEKHLQKSAIYFAPRCLEGIGMSFLEGMALGRCVVAPDYPTMNEYIEDGVNGFLYNLEKPEKIEIEHIRDIQNNTVKFIEDGYKKWNEEKYKILDWVESDVKQNRDEKLIKNKLMPVEIQKKKLKISITYLKKKITPMHKTYYLLGFIPIYRKKRKCAEELYTKNRLNCRKLIQKVFSVKNEVIGKKKYKVISIIGIKIKFKKQLEDINILTKEACLNHLYKREYILLVDNLFDNNAELCDNFALFEYLQLNPKYKDISFYIINKNNVSYEEIRKKYPDNLISVLNTTVNNELINKLVKTKYWLDSFQVINRFDCNLKKYLKESEIITVYTQHGINFMKTSFVEISNEIGDATFKKIVFSNSKERQIFKKHYGYDDRNTILAGLSRWDNLKDLNQADEKIIFLYFTFRVYLRNPNLKFEWTNYIKKITSLCTSTRIDEILKKYNVKLKVAVHHEVLNFIKDFKIPNVELIKDKDIGDIKQKASLFITDYSSMCFDFMYKNKPVIFYRIDYNDSILATNWADRVDQISSEFQNENVYNVFYDENNVVNKIAEYCKNNFKLEEEYKQKNNKFFTYRENIRARLIEGILSSPENIPNDCNREPYEDINFNQQYNFGDDILYAISTEYLTSPRNNSRNSSNESVRLWFKLPEKKEACVIINLASTIESEIIEHSFEVFLNDKYIKTIILKNRYNTDIKIPLSKEDVKLKVQKIMLKAKLKKSNLGLKLNSMKINKVEALNE